MAAICQKQRLACVRNDSSALFTLAVIPGTTHGWVRHCFWKNQPCFPSSGQPLYPLCVMKKLLLLIFFKGTSAFINMGKNGSFVKKHSPLLSSVEALSSFTPFPLARCSTNKWSIGVLIATTVYVPTATQYIKKKQNNLFLKQQKSLKTINVSYKIHLHYIHLL